MKPSNSTPSGTTAWSTRVREWLPALGFMLLILIARSTLADHYHVPSGSMEPSLVPGDHVLVDKSAYGFRFPFTNRILIDGDAPRAGDVVIFDSPVDGVRLIKRVVAVAGDEVAVRAGRVWINGAPRATVAAPSPDQPTERVVIERYDDRAVPLNLVAGGGPDLAPVQVPEGQLLVLGDHRGNSRDGRSFGFVPAAAVYGRATGVFWRRGPGPTWQSL